MGFPIGLVRLWEVKSSRVSDTCNVHKLDCNTHSVVTTFQFNTDVATKARWADVDERGGRAWKASISNAKMMGRNDLDV